MSMDKLDNKKIRKIVFDKYNGHCAYCGCILYESNFTIDHIVPKRRYPTKREKGEDRITNYAPCCFSCNSSKSTLSVEEFKESLNAKLRSLYENSSQFRILLRFGMVTYTNKKVVFYYENF